MFELAKMVPDPDMLLALPVEELAFKVMGAISIRMRNEGRNNFHPNNEISSLAVRNVSGSPSYPLERQDEIFGAVAEALGWLEAQGLIVEDHRQHGGWKRFSRRAAEVADEKSFVDFRTGRMLPREIMHPSLLPEVWLDFARGRLDHAVFQSMKAVEVAVRRAGKFPIDLCGDDLFRAAFKPDGGALIDAAAPGGEREGLFFVYRGMFLRYRNSHGHRYADPGAESPEDTIGVILMASHLLREIDRIEARSAA